MAIQYPKSLTGKYVKSKIGVAPEFNRIHEAIGDYESSIAKFEENKPATLLPAINGIVAAMDQLSRARDLAVKNFEAKAKSAKDKEKAAIQKTLELLKAIAVEIDSGNKVVMNQLLTIKKEHEERVTWDDWFKTNCGPEKMFLEGLEKNAAKDAATVAAALMQIGEALKQPDALSKKKDLKTRLEDLSKVADKKLVTGIPGFPSMEDAFKNTKNKFKLVQLSPLEAKPRDEFLARLDAVMPMAIKRRDTIKKTFDALTAAVTKLGAPNPAPNP